MKLDLESVAYHESGHAVIANRCKSKLDFIEINYNNNTWSGKHKVTHVSNLATDLIIAEKAIAIAGMLAQAKRAVAVQDEQVKFDTTADLSDLLAFFVDPRRMNDLAEECICPFLLDNTSKKIAISEYCFSARDHLNFISETIMPISNEEKIFIIKKTMIWLNEDDCWEQIDKLVSEIFIQKFSSKIFLNSSQLYAILS